ncbi:MAG TPA: DUF3570 domain-containing protein [Burkholderiaceae bacterium]|nr:DUF3570 domain-containing protein [Burkholderiaceae bacterium]
MPIPARARPALLAAALALPGVAPPAEASGPPERAQLDVRWLHYRDGQPGFDRIRVDSPSIGLKLPVAGRWTIDAVALQDTVSGASPRWHSAVSGASRLSERRRAGDLRVTHHWERATLTAGAVASSENDYRSRAGSLLATWATEDRDTTWAFGLGRADDRIDPVNRAVINERRRTLDVLIGITRVLTAVDVLQVNLTHARGEGYFSDPYKVPDVRPRERDQTALWVRWNRFVEPLGGTMRLGWRGHVDSWDVQSHALTAEWVQPLPGGWSVAPSLRYYTQSAAGFYFDPVYDPALGEPFPPGFLANPLGVRSPDARLSAFGAATLGLRVAKWIDRSTAVDVRVDLYEQRAGWRLGGSGSPGLAPLRATSLQLGLTRLF